ncbi:MAG: hypothetical protein C0478_05600 [Planctomyces sp.]|nr:hypothetical protein [Planctomyces sp.]
MTTYDIVMLLIVVGMAIQGAWRGLAWQVAPVASLILGYMVAGPLSPSLAPLFGKPPLADVLALVAVYVAVSLAVYLMIRSVKESLEKLKLAEFDKHLGFLLGAVKGIILTVVVTVVLITVSPAAREMILQTESHSIARLIIGEALPLMPETFRSTLAPYLREFQTDNIAYQNDGNFPGDRVRSRTSTRPSPARPQPGELTGRDSRYGNTTETRPVSQQGSESTLNKMWDQIWGGSSTSSNAPAAQPSGTPTDRFRNYDPYSPGRTSPPEGSSSQGGYSSNRVSGASGSYPSGSSRDGGYAPNNGTSYGNADPYRSGSAYRPAPLWGDNEQGGDAPLFDASSVTRDFVRDQIVNPALGRARDEFDRSIRESWPDSFSGSTQPDPASPNRVSPTPPRRSTGGY